MNREGGGSRRVRAVRITRILRAALVAAALAACAAPVLAVDGVAIEAGQATRTDTLRIAAQWQWPQRWLQGGNWHLGGFWELNAGQWERESRPGERSRLSEIGITPVFRIQANDLRGFYLEGGIGVHLLSATALGNKRFGTAFQFGDHLGLGYRFGARGAFDVGYRYQHLSNADIKRPNNGLDLHQVRLLYWFR